MHKSLLALTTTATMVLLLVTACADKDEPSATVDNKQPAATEDVKKSATGETKVPVPKVKREKKTAKAFDADAPIMNQPVDFSTPESISKSLQAIREQAGARAVRKMESAMGYMLTYDLAVGRDEAKMYKKLNGKTPNEIIAMGTARR